MKSQPNIVWATRSFLDYRVPVFEALSRLTGGNLSVLFSGDYVPSRVTAKVQSVLGDRALPLDGEWRLGREDREFMANRNVSLRWQPGLGRRIRELRPDVLVTDGFFKWALPCLLYRIRHGIPLVICYERTAHTERNVQGFRTLYRRWAVRHTDAMCCNGRLCGEYTQSLGMPVERITYGHMAADTEALSGKARRASLLRPASFGAQAGTEREALRNELRVQGVTFLYVGRLVACKGLQEFLAAWKNFEGEHGGLATLCLVGDGPLRGELATQCRESALGAVRFVGDVEPDDVHRYYAAADVLVMPTLEDNWSLVVPEAMACGLPVLCSRYNGCWPELVQNGRNGWVFDPRDMQDVIRVLESAIADGTDLRQMGMESKAIVEDHTPQKAAQAVLDACEIAHRHRAGRGG